MGDVSVSPADSGAAFELSRSYLAPAGNRALARAHVLVYDS
jgi:hypothetical protein